ncbi:MAG: hypothetical protein M3313_08300 [Actinomycetota bacterium]|nr:hypothetical protein [Actinomycetota bacterium]
MPEDGFDVGVLDERLASVVRGRRVIVVTAVAAQATQAVHQLRRYGARRPLVITHGPGLGAAPTAQDADMVVHPLPDRPTLMSAELQSHIAFVANLPAAVVEAVDTYDPELSALWWLAPMAEAAETLLGRQVLGGRRAHWSALEDKTLVDQVFDAAGVRRPPAVVVPAQASALPAAALDLDSGNGTVWSGDAREGMNGGGEFVRWVRTVEAADRAGQFFETHCDRVRVSPFLDGVPCSIHGVVLPDGVAVLRPVELLVLRGQEDRFLYAGMSTWWDPPAQHREVMRDAARRVGAHLAETVGFRGGFSVDGVLSSTGWLPTELNPRFAGGLTTIARALIGFPLQFLQAAVVAGLDTGFTARGLEHGLLSAADERRNMVLHAVSTAFRADSTITDHVVLDGQSLRRAEPDADPDGMVEVGPAALGVIVRFKPAASTMAPGQRAAAYACAALDFADREYGTGFGHCTPAPEISCASTAAGRG